MSNQCNWGDLIFYGLIFLLYVFSMIATLIVLIQHINAVKKYGWHTRKFSTEWMPYSAGTVVVGCTITGIFGGYYFIYKLGLYLLSILEKC